MPAPARTSPATSRTRILLIEDDEPTRHAYRKLLECNGYEVHEAENGADGLEAAELVGPDIVITDLIMPLLDGCEMARQLKADPATRPIPIIAATGESSRPRGDDAHHFHAVLRKPFTPGEMLRVLEGVQVRTEASPG